MIFFEIKGADTLVITYGVTARAAKVAVKKSCKKTILWLHYLC